MKRRNFFKAMWGLAAAPFAAYLPVAKANSKAIIETPYAKLHADAIADDTLIFRRPVPFTRRTT